MPWRHPFPQDNRRFEQGLRPRQQECNGHLKMWLRVSAIVYQLLWVIWLEKSLLTILESNWYERFEDGKKKDGILSPHNSKTDHFTSLISIGQERLRNVQKWKTLVRSMQKMLMQCKVCKSTVFIANYANLRCSCRHRHRCCLNSVMLDI